MFSKPEQLVRRTGKKGVGRFDYLQQLVTEFQETESIGVYDILFVGCLMSIDSENSICLTTREKICT